jgi:hypothetical protein
MSDPTWKPAEISAARPPTAGASSATPAQDGPLITVERAAEILLCSRSRIFELIGVGTLTRGPKFGKHTVVMLESVLGAAEGSEAKKPRAPRLSRRQQKNAQFEEELRAALERSRG